MIIFFHRNDVRARSNEGQWQGRELWENYRKPIHADGRSLFFIPHS